VCGHLPILARATDNTFCNAPIRLARSGVPMIVRGSRLETGRFPLTITKSAGYGSGWSDALKIVRGFRLETGRFPLTITKSAGRGSGRGSGEDWPRRRTVGRSHGAVHTCGRPGAFDLRIGNADDAVGGPT
jgi:hypothetical protein